MPGTTWLPRIGERRPTRDPRKNPQPGDVLVRARSGSDIRVRTEVTSLTSRTVRVLDQELRPPMPEAEVEAIVAEMPEDFREQSREIIAASQVSAKIAQWYGLKWWRELYADAEVVHVAPDPSTPA